MRKNAGDGGFTLIELAVVVVIIGILISVAMVTFLGARERASDTAAQARVTDALKAQKVIYSDGNGFTDDEGVLEATEPSLDFVGDAVVLGAVYVKLDGDTVTLASRSATGACYWVRDSGATPLYASGSCDPTSPTLDWGQRW